MASSYIMAFGPGVALLSFVVGFCTADKYVYVEDLSRYVEMVAGNSMLLGRLDRNGNLVVEEKYRRFAGRTGPASTLINGANLENDHVYEFRSGRLIRGTMKLDGRFVPDADSEITDFKDYRYGPDAIRIYNLPGYFEPVQPQDK